MMMMMMMIVDLYSALRRAPLLRYVPRCIVKMNVFSAGRKNPMLSDGSRRWSGSRFQTIGPDVFLATVLRFSGWNLLISICYVCRLLFLKTLGKLKKRKNVETWH